MQTNQCSEKLRKVIFLCPGVKKNVLLITFLGGNYQPLFSTNKSLS